MWYGSGHVKKVYFKWLGWECDVVVDVDVIHSVICVEVVGDGVIHTSIILFGRTHSKLECVLAQMMN